MGIFDELTKGATDAVKFRTITRVVIVAAAFIFYINSDLPGAGRVRSVLGMGA